MQGGLLLPAVNEQHCVVCITKSLPWGQRRQRKTLPQLPAGAWVVRSHSTGLLRRLGASRCCSSCCCLLVRRPELSWLLLLLLLL